MPEITITAGSPSAASMRNIVNTLSADAATKVATAVASASNDTARGDYTPSSAVKIVEYVLAGVLLSWGSTWLYRKLFVAGHSHKLQ